MFKMVFVFCTLISTVSLANILTCDVFKNTSAIITNTEKVILTFSSTAVETIDYIKSEANDNGEKISSEKRIYSRVYPEVSNRGGYTVDYCNPDDNEVNIYSGIRIYSQCKAAQSSDDVFFSFRLNKDYTKGQFSIDYLGSEIVSMKMSLENCK